MWPLSNVLQKLGLHQISLTAIRDPCCQTACLWMSASAVCLSPVRPQNCNRYRGLVLASHVAYRLVLMQVSHYWRRGNKEANSPTISACLKMFFLPECFCSKNTKSPAENLLLSWNLGAKLILWALVISSVVNSQLYAGKWQLQTYPTHLKPMSPRCPIRMAKYFSKVYRMRMSDPLNFVREPAPLDIYG